MTLSAARPNFGMSQPSPPPEREPGDPRRRDGATGDRQLVLAGRGIELRPRHAPLGACRSGLRVDLDVLHLGQVDHHGVVRDREPATL